VGKLPISRRLVPQYVISELQFIAETREMLPVRARARKVVNCMLALGGLSKAVGLRKMLDSSC
jgi:hypothetical protein